MKRLLPLLLLTASFLECPAWPADEIRSEQWQPHDFELRAAPVPPGNPFDVEVRGEFRGPRGARLSVPGFYDGDGLWRIRFSAPAAGEWRMRTASPLPPLDGKTFLIRAAANTNPSVHGGLRVDAERPYHFRFEDGTRFFLMGYECDWLWALDLNDAGGDAALPRTRELVDGIRRHGFNYVILNVYAHDTRWSPGRPHAWDFGPPALYAWEGTNEKPDHSRLNTRFFRHYDRVIDYLHRGGVIAHIMI
ncbi:MAG: DUF5060 domain-containing protein, partial [Terriglobales bacterium]